MSRVTCTKRASEGEREKEDRGKKEMQREMQKREMQREEERGVRGVRCR